MLQILSNRSFEKYFLPCLGGVLGGLSISNNFWILMMPISISILWGTIHNRNANFIWGFSFVSISHYWLLYLHPLTWMGVSWIMSLLISVLIWFICGSLGGILVLIWGFIGGIFFSETNIFLTNKIKLMAKVLLLSFLWSISELILTQTSFFWIGIGESLIPGDLYLAGLASWFGSGGLSVMTLILGFWIFYIFHSWKNKQKFLFVFVYGLLINCFLHLIGSILIQHPNNGVKYPLAIWQTNIPVREKVFLDKETLSEKIIAIQKKALINNAKLLVMPEGTLNSDFYFEKDGSLINTLAGGFRKVNNKLRNSLMAFREGENFYSSFVDKFRLVPLGEYIPTFLKKTLKTFSLYGSLDKGEMSRLIKWRGSPPLAIAICYEIADAEGIRKAIRNGAQLILAVANLDPYPPIIQAQMLSLARIRSIENNREGIIVSNTGPSAHIGGDGRLRLLLDSNVEKFKVIYPLLLNSKTFFSNFGNIPLILIFILLIPINLFYGLDEIINPPPSKISPK